LLCDYPFIARVRCRMQGYQSTVGVGSLRGFPSIEGVSLRDYPSVVAFHVHCTAELLKNKRGYWARNYSPTVAEVAANTN